MEMPFWVENFEISGSNAFAFRLDIFLHLLGRSRKIALLYDSSPEKQKS